MTLRRELVRTGALLAACIAAAALVAWRLPLPADDPFRGTLVVLPLILGAWREIHLWGARLGGRALGVRTTAGELGALSVLVLLVLARPHLSIVGMDEILAAGLLLVLGCRVARQVLALRALLGDRLPRRPSLLFLLLPFVVYIAILPWSARHRQPDGDEPFNLLVTHSLAYDFDADLTNNYAHGDWRYFMDRPIEPQPGDPVGPHGERYSRHNELLPMVLAPAYRLAGKMGALATMALLTAALAWMTLRLARHYVPDGPGESLAAWSLVAFAPPLLLYSYQVWVEVPAALLAAVAIDRIFLIDPIDGGRRWGAKEWLGLGLPLLLLPLLKIRLVLISGPLLVLGWWHAGRHSRRLSRPLLILAALLAVLAGGMLLYNQILYSNPLKIHTWQEVDPVSYGPASYLKGMSGLFFDAAFGLFGTAPVWLLLLPALLLLATRRSRLLAHMAVLSLPYLLVVVPRVEWYGGWSPPFRYALIAMPLLGIALVAAVRGDSGPRGRPGAAGGPGGADAGADARLGGGAGLDLQLRGRPHLRARRPERPAGAGRRALLPQLDPPPRRHLDLASDIDPAGLAALVVARETAASGRRGGAGGRRADARGGGPPPRGRRPPAHPGRRAGGPAGAQERRPPPSRPLGDRAGALPGGLGAAGGRAAGGTGRLGRTAAEAPAVRGIHPQPAGPLHARRQTRRPAPRLLDPEARAGLGSGRCGTGRLAGRRAAGARRPRAGASGGAERGDSGPGRAGVAVRVTRPGPALKGRNLNSLGFQPQVKRPHRFQVPKGRQIFAFRTIRLGSATLTGFGFWKAPCLGLKPQAIQIPPLWGGDEPRPDIAAKVVAGEAVAR